MHDPGTRVVSAESDCDIIAGSANADNISDRGVDEVVGRATGRTDNMEGVLGK